MSNGSYRSTGTIRVRFKFGRVTRKYSTKLLFTPNPDSTVRYGGKKYAVFIHGDGDKASIKSKPLGDSCDGIPIKLKADLPGLVAAATRRTLVEVEINRNWVLRAITIPAPSRKK